MALEINSVKISELQPINQLNLEVDDILVVNDVEIAGQTTKRFTIGNLISLITQQDLNFTGDVTFSGTIQALPNKDLDAIFRDLTVERTLTIASTADVEGLYLNQHLEDVDVDTNLITDYHTLFWKGTEWVNEKGVEEAPDDGRAYARRNQMWVPIATVAEENIGAVNIISNLNNGNASLYQAYQFAASITGSAKELNFSWSFSETTRTSMDDVVIIDPDKQATRIVFNKDGYYLIMCEVSSDNALDSPVVGTLAVTVLEGITYRIMSENQSLLRMEDDSGYILQEHTPVPTPTPQPTPQPTPEPTDPPTPTPEPTNPPGPTPDPYIPAFDVDYILSNNQLAAMDSKYSNALMRAVERWNGFLKANQRVFDYNEASGDIFAYRKGSRLTEFIEYTNSNPPPGNFIASCGPTRIYRLEIFPGDPLPKNNKYFYPVEFSLTANTRDYGGESEDFWYVVFSHELGHALGMPLCWQQQTTGRQDVTNNLLNGLEYTNAQAAYNSITGLSVDKMPLEVDGGGGTEGAHWDDSRRSQDGVVYYGLDGELMTGFIDLNSVISALDIGIFTDLGWEEITPGANEGTPSAVMGLQVNYHNKIRVIPYNRDHLRTPRFIGPQS